MHRGGIVWVDLGFDKAGIIKVFEKRNDYLIIPCCITSLTYLRSADSLSADGSITLRLKSCATKNKMSVTFLDSGCVNSR